MFVHMSIAGETTHMIMYKNGRGEFKRKVINFAGIDILVTYAAADEDVHIGGCGVPDSEDSGNANYFPGFMAKIAMFDVALKRTIL